MLRSGRGGGRCGCDACCDAPGFLLPFIFAVSSARAATDRWESAGLDVTYTIPVVDTLTGLEKDCVNPAGRLESVADTAAF